VLALLLQDLRHLGQKEVKGPCQLRAEKLLHLWHCTHEHLLKVACILLLLQPIPQHATDVLHQSLIWARIVGSEHAEHAHHQLVQPRVILAQHT
jgi:hypothetical protein